MEDQNSILQYNPQLSFPSDLPPSLTDNMFYTLSHSQLKPDLKLYVGLDEKETEAGRKFADSVLDLEGDISPANGKAHAISYAYKQKRRRQNLMFQSLQTLLPNPTKADQASILGDAIEYIKDLLRTIEEKKMLVQQKRPCKRRSKRHITNNQESQSCSEASLLQCGQNQKFINSSLQHTTCGDGTLVDVHILYNEVNIKLIHKKRHLNCLLCVSLILQELPLEILHANAAKVGEYYIIIFNTQIYGGSCHCERSIATKLIDALHRNLNISRV